MKKIKTPSTDYAHLTKDGATTVCGRKIYTYWIETDVENIEICMDCEIDCLEKETEQDEEPASEQGASEGDGEEVNSTEEESAVKSIQGERNEESTEVKPVRVTKPKGNKLASW